MNEIIIDNDDTSHLNWYSISKSRDGEYQTPPEVAEAIYQVLQPLVKRNHIVFDPTAGSGRLLKPFKHVTNVFGIEFKDSLSNSLKHNIGVKNARQCDLVTYAESFFEYNSRYSFVVMNPPFGLKWNTNSYRYNCKQNDESQFMATCIAYENLVNEGIMALIIPTSTWTNQKDKRFASFLRSNMKILHRVTMHNAFKKEYKIKLDTDIVFLKKPSGHMYSFYNNSFPETEIDINDIETLPEIVNLSEHEVPEILKNNIKLFYKEMPHVNKFTTFVPKFDSLTINKSGIVGSELQMSLLDFYDATDLDDYNSVYGRRASIKSCYFDIPSIIRNGLQPTQTMCYQLGFNLQLSDNDIKKFKSLKKKWDFKAIPLYAPQARELLAYFENKHYKAKADITNEAGNYIYRKDKEYLIKPTWTRTKIKVDEKDITKNGLPTGEIEVRSLDSGWLQLHVTSEVGIMKYTENNEDEVKQFVASFELPDVKGMAELYPERVNHWATNLNKNYPSLMSFQFDDLTRLLCKQEGYIGFEQGLGKTLSSMVYATQRQYQRVLIICQGSLAQNWKNEAEKFGFNASIIKSHKQITKLRDRIKAKDFTKHKTEFFIIGQEFLSLDSGKVYDTWTVNKYDSDGEVTESKTGNSQKILGKTYEVEHKECPRCGKNHSNGWSGRFCSGCGYTAYSYGRREISNGETEDTKKGVRQYPAYKRITKLFSCIITDESQSFANVSLRGEASRAMKGKSKLLLTGTIMSNYVKDVFHNFGWLVGFNNPIYYFGKGKIKDFNDEFGSYETLSREYLDEMKNTATKNRKNGQSRMIPAVSNLNRFWRLMSPFTVRRLSNEVPEIKSIEREVNVHYLDMEQHHFDMYDSLNTAMTQKMNMEFAKEDVNLGVISKCLWTLREAASCPSHPALSDTGMRMEPSMMWNKLYKMEEIIKDAKAKGDKVIVFSGFPFLQNLINEYLNKKGYLSMHVGAKTKPNKRTRFIEKFEKRYDVLVTGNKILNKGFTIIGANHVIMMDLEYNPEILTQAEFRPIRLGQKKKVNIHYLLSSQTIDEEMQEVCESKKEAIASAIDKTMKNVSLAKMLEQADNRNIEVKIAKQLVGKKEKIIYKPVTFEVAEEQKEEIDFIDDDGITLSDFGLFNNEEVLDRKPTANQIVNSEIVIDDEPEFEF